MKARSARHAEKPGAYQIATRTARTTLNPGEALKLEQYITGYGEVSSAKILAYISTDAFEKDETYVQHSLKQTVRDGKQLFIWGGCKSHIDESGLTLTLEGIILNGEGESHFAFDNVLGSGEPSLACEKKHTNAPFEYVLKTKADLSPGDYYIDFYFTYFNGEKWTTTKERIPFKIRNFFERHSKSISWLAIVASTLGIIKFAAAPLLMFALAL